MFGSYKAIAASMITVDVANETLDEFIELNENNFDSFTAC